MAARSLPIVVALLGLACVSLASAAPLPRSLDFAQFQSKLEKAQALSDEAKRPQDAMKAMLALRGALTATPRNQRYIDGLEISILWMAKAARDEKTVRTQIEEVLRRPNARYSAIERSERQGNITFRIWHLGYTHPQVVTEFILPGKVKSAKSPAERLALLKDAAVKWGNFDYARAESDYGMSYGDSIVENIWDDGGLDVSTRIETLKALTKNLKGSALGNAEYCLADLSKKVGDLAASRRWDAACARTYGALSQSKEHHRRMLELCESAAR